MKICLYFFNWFMSPVIFSEAQNLSFQMNCFRSGIFLRLSTNVLVLSETALSVVYVSSRFAKHLLPAGVFTHVAFSGLVFTWEL